MTSETAHRPRAYVRVQGPDAVDYLNRMLSKDVPDSGSADALLLTAKARVIAPLLVWRRGTEDVLLLTEPELGEAVRTQLLRTRFAAKCEIEAEQHVSTVVLGEGDGIQNRDYGRPAVEVLDAKLEATLGDDELERLRIEAATPRYGREIDDRVLPAEAGLDERAISFSKGCYPGQEPVARQHFRGKVNRRLRVLEVDGDAPEPETSVMHDGKDVGRVTSAVPGLALAYVRVAVPEDAALDVGGRTARLRSSTATLTDSPRP
ncbi:MAG: tRNA-modifying protein YgfZ [Gaiellaceae bacterium]|nr:tRNA-modifying protein YgfZ [Gaiellaceae bacterium]